MNQMKTKPAAAHSYWTVAVLTVVLGGLAGVFGSMTSGYQATTNLPFDGDLPVFKAADAEVNAPGQWPLFAATLGSEKDKAEFSAFASQIATGRSKVEHSFRLSRRDFLDLPESASKEIVERLANSRGGRSNIRITTRADDPQEASRMARYGAEYMRYSLVAVRLRDLLKNWTTDVDSERAQLVADNLTRESRIQSFNRQLAAMGELSAKFKDTAEITPPSPSLDPNPVQVQVAGAKYLSPARQIIGLQSALIEVREELQIARERMDYINVLQDFANRNTKAGLPDLMAAADKLQGSSVGGVLLGQSKAKADIMVRLLAINSLQTVPLEPKEPILQRVGLGLWRSAALGALLGLLVGMGLMFREQLGAIWSDRPKT